MLKTLSIITLGVTVITLGTVTKAKAAQIFAPSSVSTDMGEGSGSPGRNNIENMINQSGLTVGYTSGVTNFDSYLSGNPKHSFRGGNLWVSDTDVTTGSITFDLGNVLNLEGMALWTDASTTGSDVRALGTRGVSDFELFASLTGHTGSFTTLGSFTANKTSSRPSSAQVFNFNTTAQFIRMDIKSNQGYSFGTAIGEVAFNATPVPEPLTILGSATALGFGILFNQKISRRLKNEP